jgi:hypothetical protein
MAIATAEVATTGAPQMGSEGLAVPDLTEARGVNDVLASPSQTFQRIRH